MPRKYCSECGQALVIGRDPHSNEPEWETVESGFRLMGLKRAETLR
jgi:hypothetical protein